MTQRPCESSVLFSLRELMTLEERRVAEEAARRSRVDEAAAEARGAEERRRDEEREAGRREEESRARAEVERRREEAVRLQAIRDAETERVRREADSAHRLEALRLQQQHERATAAERGDARRTGLARTAWGLGIALVLVVVAGGVVASRRASEAEGSAARDRQAAARQRETFEAMGAALARQREELALLEESARGLRTAPTPPPPVSTDAPAARDPKGRPAVTAAAGGRPGRPSTSKPAPACAHEWDPLCPQLP